VQCPITRDVIRKYPRIPQGGPYTWETEHSINRFALNIPVDLADEPARNVMFGEPNMQRATIYYIPHVIAAGTFGSRPDLEEHNAGSLAFGFADGHAARVTVPCLPRGDAWWKVAYPQLALSAGSPPSPIQYAASNYFWWHSGQVTSQNRAIFPPANDYTNATLPRPPMIPRT